MKRHEFVPVESPKPDTVCEGCHLTWGTIAFQMLDEMAARGELPVLSPITDAIEGDDCDVRKRLNDMKAFW